MWLLLVLFRDVLPFPSTTSTSSTTSRSTTMCVCLCVCLPKEAAFLGVRAGFFHMPAFFGEEGDGGELVTGQEAKEGGDTDVERCGGFAGGLCVWGCVCVCV
jgi:hypothetical protein